jgi:hypothetical protein
VNNLLLAVMPIAASSAGVFVVMQRADSSSPCNRQRRTSSGSTKIFRHHGGADQGLNTAG